MSEPNNNSERIYLRLETWVSENTWELQSFWDPADIEQLREECRNWVEDGVRARITEVRVCVLEVFEPATPPA